VSSGLIIFLELSLVLGLALFFGFRELRNLRRYDRERRMRADAAGEEPADVSGGARDRTTGDRRKTP
jgi:hypothetical protein